MPKKEFTCESCGNIFVAWPSTNQKYCSIQCAGKARRTYKVPKSPPTCLNCGKTITKERPHRLHKRKYCGRECYHAYTRGPQHPNYDPKTKTTANCKICDKQFSYYKKANHRGLYCSRECAQIAFVQEGWQAGENNANWKGYKRTRAVMTQFVHRHMPPSCAICGWNICSCDGHHIIPVKEGGEHILTNIIMLCPNHHRMARCGLISKSELKELWIDNYGHLELPGVYF